MRNQDQDQDQDQDDGFDASEMERAIAESRRLAASLRDHTDAVGEHFGGELPADLEEWPPPEHSVVQGRSGGHLQDSHVRRAPNLSLPSESNELRSCESPTGLEDEMSPSKRRRVQEAFDETVRNLDAGDTGEAIRLAQEDNGQRVEDLLTLPEQREIRKLVCHTLGNPSSSDSVLDNYISAMKFALEENGCQFPDALDAYIEKVRGSVLNEKVRAVAEEEQLVANIDDKGLKRLKKQIDQLLWAQLSGEISDCIENSGLSQEAQARLHQYAQQESQKYAKSRNETSANLGQRDHQFEDNNQTATKRAESTGRQLGTASSSPQERLTKSQIREIRVQKFGKKDF